MSSTTYRIGQVVFYPRCDFLINCAKSKISSFSEKLKWAFEKEYFRSFLLSLCFSEKLYGSDEF